MPSSRTCGSSPAERKPPRPNRAEPAPQRPEDPPAREPEPVPVPANVPGWPGWAAFVERLKGALDMGDYMLIKNPAMAEGRFDGQKLTVWTSIEVVRNTLAKPGVAQPMAELCGRLTGVVRQVEVKAGQAPPEELPSAPAGEVDPLAAFLVDAGPNIIVE